MEKVYAPQEIERRIYERWESNGWFAPRALAQDPTGQSDARPGSPAASGTVGAAAGQRATGPATYSIAIPPPNVTGTLHMGHAFQHTLMDMLTRYHRMIGDDTLWQPGTDHAGIATQMVVERQLDAEGVKRTDLTRDEFIARVWKWKEQSGGTITSQMRRLGDSVDWSRDRFTMDEGLSKAVIETFVRLPWVSWAAPKAIRSDMSGPSLLGLVGAELTAGTAKPTVLKPTGTLTLPDGGAGLTVDDAAKRDAVERFLAG